MSDDVRHLTFCFQRFCSAMLQRCRTSFSRAAQTPVAQFSAADRPRDCACRQAALLRYHDTLQRCLKTRITPQRVIERINFQFQRISGSLVDRLVDPG